MRAFFFQELPVIALSWHMRAGVTWRRHRARPSHLLTRASQEILPKVEDDRWRDGGDMGEGSSVLGNTRKNGMDKHRETTTADHRFYRCVAAVVFFSWSVTRMVCRNSEIPWGRHLQLLLFVRTRSLPKLLRWYIRWWCGYVHQYFINVSWPARDT